MNKSFIKKCLLSSCVMILSTQQAWANNVNTQALELAGQKNFTEALSLLASQSHDTKQGYDHRFLEARIQSWAGRYTEARQTIGSLMAEYPANADLELALGNLEYYQGNLDAAERQYERVLALAPNYTDASNGLANVRKARQSQTSHSWRIDGGSTVSTFDIDNLSNWNEQFLRAEYIAGGIAYSGAVTRYKRFDKNDVQLNIGLADAVRGGFDWGVDVGITPDSDFRPKFSLGGRAGHAIESAGGTVFYLGSSYRFDQYDTGDIHSIQPELLAYLENGVVLTGRLIGTVQKQEKDQLGWLVQGLAPVGDKVKFRAGYARAPETINGIAITTESLFGGLSYTIRESLELHLNYSRDDRENAYVREGFNVGFTHKR